MTMNEAKYYYYYYSKQSKYERINIFLNTAADKGSITL